jgi:hypothetical protein
MVRKRPAKFLTDLTPEEPVKIEVIPDETPAKPMRSFESTENTELTPAMKEVIAPPGDACFASEHLLNESEREFYLRRRTTYIEEFNLNKSGDIGIIHRIIMEEIITERLYGEMLEHPGRDYSAQITESHARYMKALDSLGASRDKRIRNRETNTMSIADVSREFFETGKAEAWAEKKIVRDAEEKALAAEKDHSLALEYGTIESEVLHGDESDG